MNKFILISILILIIALVTGLFVFSDKIPFMSSFMDIIGIKQQNENAIENKDAVLNRKSGENNATVPKEEQNESPTYSAFGSVSESMPTIDKSEVNPTILDGDPLVNCSSPECGEITMKQSTCIKSVCCQVDKNWEWLQDKESCEIAQNEVNSDDRIVNCQNPKCGEKTMSQSECTSSVCCETTTGWKWTSSQEACLDTQGVQ